MGRKHEIVCGVWMGAHVKAVDGLVHRGGWTCVNNLWGEVRTVCGIDELGYLSLDDVTCEQCEGAA